MKTIHLFFTLLILLVIGACQKDEVTEIVSETETETETEINIETPDWTEATHSKDVDPNYDVVFPDNEVHRIDITISAEDWSSMQADLAVNLNTGRGPGGGPPDIDFTPIWVPSSLKFNGIEWYKVGIRYKGNSTLSGAYRDNTDKFPFKLDFDEFEDTYPDIKNQRFYGFKQLNLSSNYQDASFMREKVAADLFREFGVPAARTSFCAVYLDRGNGSNYIGMYTLIEEVDNTLPDAQFADGDGNLYKPDGTAASFAAETYNESDMDKKNNEDEADYSDVKGLYDLLHSGIRTSNETQWKSDLEGIFDVDRYLKYLAANTVIQNWDTYGRMTHNYFLFNDGGKLVWIPWDNNESMQEGKMDGALSLSLSEVGADWPLIRYVVDVDEYKDQYQAYLQEFSDQVFEPTRMSTLYSTYESLLSNLATQENASFSSAVSTLKTHAQSRQQAVDEYL